MKARYMQSLRILPSLGVLALVAACATTPEEPVVFETPSFMSVQPELFGVVGSLSNVWGDFDNDGDLDFAVSLKGGEIRLYTQDNGVFTSVGESYGLPVSGPEFRGLSWGDYDGDGDIDLFAGATSPKELTRVFRNDGGKGFTDVAADIGLTIPGRSARQSNWVDYDNDGDLDLYSGDRMVPDQAFPGMDANPDASNKLFANTNAVFSQVFAGEGPTDARPTVGVCWFDYNKDGRLDVFLANQSGATDALWRNDGDAFVDVAPELGLDTSGRTKQEGGVGCAIGDYDNDGNLDIYLSAYGPNQLYHNNGDGTFTEVGEALGVTEPDHVVSAEWGDYDNDGDLDLFVVGYEGPSGEQVPHNMFYRNDGDAGFVNILVPGDMLNAGDHGVVWVDYDRDGDLDLSLTDGYGPEGGHFVFRNEMSAAGQARSLEVLMLDSKGNFTVPGAEVRLYDKAGKLLATRMVTTGGGYNAQSAIPVHFGLKSTGAVTLEVTWMTPDGRKTQTMKGVKPSDWTGKLLEIRKPVDF